MSRVFMISMITYFCCPQADKQLIIPLAARGQHSTRVWYLSEFSFNHSRHIRISKVWFKDICFINGVGRVRNIPSEPSSEAADLQGFFCKTAGRREQRKTRWSSREWGPTLLQFSHRIHSHVIIVYSTVTSAGGEAHTKRWNLSVSCRNVTDRFSTVTLSIRESGQTFCFALFPSSTF